MGPKWSLRSAAREVTGRLIDAAKSVVAAEPDAPSPDEIDLTEAVGAVRQVFSEVEDLDRDAAARRIAEVLGFDRMSPKVRDLAESALNAAARRKVITTERGRVFLLTRSIDDYPRDERVEFLLAAMREAGGPALWERDETIITASRYLGFRRTGQRIEQAFKSAINGAIRRGLLERDGSQIRRI